jgi:hypothetical protein
LLRRIDWLTAQEHEMESIQGGDGFKAAEGRPDSPAGKSMDVRMEIEAVAPLTWIAVAPTT